MVHQTLACSIIQQVSQRCRKARHRSSIHIVTRFMIAQCLGKETNRIHLQSFQLIKNGIDKSSVAAQKVTAIKDDRHGGFSILGKLLQKRLYRCLSIGIVVGYAWMVEAVVWLWCWSVVSKTSLKQVVGQEAKHLSHVVRTAIRVKVLYDLVDDIV